MIEDEKSVNETENFVTTNSDTPVVKTEEPKEPEVKAEDKEAKEPGKEPEAKPEGKEEVKEKSDDKTVTSDDDATAEQPKKKGGVQKRIDTLVRDREDEKRKNESLAQKNKELQDQLDAKKKGASEPKEEDFETYDDFLDAMDKHEEPSSTEKKPGAKENEKTPEQEPLTDSQRTALAVMQEKIKDAASKPDDFKEVALADDLDISAEMLESLAECEDPAKVMYHLGKNKSLATEIAAMTPAQQMREITKLDVTEKIKPVKPVKQTSASEPINPVGGSDTQEKPIGDMSFKEYEEAQNKKERDRSSDAW